MEPIFRTPGRAAPGQTLIDVSDPQAVSREDARTLEKIRVEGADIKRVRTCIHARGHVVRCAHHAASAFSCCGCHWMGGLASSE